MAQGQALLSVRACGFADSAVWGLRLWGLGFRGLEFEVCGLGSGFLGFGVMVL